MASALSAVTGQPLAFILNMATQSGQEREEENFLGTAL